MSGPKGPPALPRRLPVDETYLRSARSASASMEPLTIRPSGRIIVGVPWTFSRSARRIVSSTASVLQVGAGISFPAKASSSIFSDFAQTTAWHFRWVALSFGFPGRA